MFYFKSNVVCFTLFCGIFFVRCLEKLSSVENDDIAITEAVIRQTANSLFATFKIRDVGHKPRLKEFSIIHNFFVSITLKDCNNLKRISRLIQVHNLDNNTLHFIAQINEVLNEGDNSIETTEDVNVNMLIAKFINKLQDLKKTYTFNRNFANYSINAKILEHLNSSGGIFPNISNNHQIKADDDNDLNNDEIWRPTEQSGRRIFGGHRTRIKHYPFMASVHFFERFQCGGSIIKKDLVITAASCLQLAWNNRFFRENPAFLSVQVGSDYYEAGGEDIPVFELYFHPEYSPKTLHNNLALMRLSIHIVFSKKHKNVRRVQYDRSSSPLPANTDGIVIVGWGAKDRTNIVYDPWVNKISFSELDYYPLTDCQEIYSKEFVTKKHFCAGFFSKASGACQPVPAIVRLTTLLQPKTTIAMHYSDRTTKTFKLTPLGQVAKEFTKAPYDIRMNLPKDTLRILEDDKLFKDFLFTMFGNESKDDLELSEDLTEAQTKKVVGRNSKPKLTTFPSTALSILFNLEEDIADLTEVKTKKVVRRKTKTKSTISTSTPLPLYDKEDDVSDLTKVKTKKVARRTKKTKSTTSTNTPLPLYDSEDDVSDLTEVKTTKVARRKRKTKSITSTSTPLPLYDDEDDISDLTEVKTKKAVGRKIKTKSTTYTGTPLPLYDSEDDISDLTEVITKKNVGRNTITKTTTPTSTPIPLYDSEDDVPDLTKVKTKKVVGRNTKTKSTTSTSTPPPLYDSKDDDRRLDDKTVYTDEYTNQYEAKMKAFEVNTKVIKKRTKSNKGKPNKNYPTLKTTKIKLTTPFIRFSDEDLKDLDIEELMRDMKVIEASTESEKIHKSVVELDSNNNDSKLDKDVTKLKSAKTKHTTARSFLRLPDEEEYVDENDEKYLPNMKVIKDNANNADDAMSRNEDSTLEKDINDLLDDLDLRKLLESKEPTSSLIEENTKRTQQKQKKTGKKENKKPKEKDTQIASYSSGENKKEDSGESDFDK